MLESATYHVLEAGDGDAAFRMLNTRGAQIALVLTDIVLPKINGVELTLYVKTQWPRIRIIAFTGQEESLIRSLGGFNLPVRLLHKPLEMTALLQAIAEELALEQ
jgi:CheY-like chemotaxis protein